MARMKSTDTIAKLKEQKAQLEARLKQAEARETERLRKLDTRRKIIAGALAVTHYEANQNSEFAKVLYRLMNEYVVKPQERELFAFLPPFDKDGKHISAPAVPVPDHIAKDAQERLKNHKWRPDKLSSKGDESGVSEAAE